MSDQDLEFRISQYLDGQLPADEAAALEAELAANLRARELLAEYRALNDALRKQPAIPEIHWEGFAEHIAAQLPDEPAKTYRLFLSPARLALAASLLLAVGLAFIIYNSKGSAPRPPEIAQVQGPRAESASGPAVTDITIGPADVYASTFYQRSEAMDSRPSSISLILPAGTSDEPSLYR